MDEQTYSTPSADEVTAPETRDGTEEAVAVSAAEPLPEPPTPDADTDAPAPIGATAPDGAGEGDLPAEPDADESDADAPDEPDVPDDTARLTARLALEFLELSAAVPDIQTVEQLPDEVLAAAVDEGRTLLDAFLRFRLAEENRIRCQRQREQAAADGAVGSLAADADRPVPEQEAFTRAFRAALA